MLNGLIDTASLLWFLGMAAVEDDAIARFDSTFAGDRNFAFFDASNLAEKNAAFLSESRVDQLLVVDAAKPSGVKATRKAHLQIVNVLRSEDFSGPGGLAQLVQRLAINPRNVCDVFRRLQTAFNLQRCDAGANEIR